MDYALLADLIVIVHLLYIGFVIGGELVVIVGAPLRWRWIRNPFFRIAHLLAIVIVAVDSQIGVLCPLTDWERALRRRAGQALDDDITFVAHLVRELVYYELPQWTLNAAYVLFALVVIATMVVVPPRWKQRGGAAVEIPPDRNRGSHPAGPFQTPPGVSRQRFDQDSGICGERPPHPTYDDGQSWRDIACAQCLMKYPNPHRFKEFLHLGRLIPR